MKLFTTPNYKAKRATHKAVNSVDVFCSALLAFGPYDVPRIVAKCWTLEQRARIYDFVIDQHLRAGDHIIRKPRPKPEFFKYEVCDF